MINLTIGNYFWYANRETKKAEKCMIVNVMMYSYPPKILAKKQNGSTFTCYDGFGCFNTEKDAIKDAQIEEDRIIYLLRKKESKMLFNKNLKINEFVTLDKTVLNLCKKDHVDPMMFADAIPLDGLLCDIPEFKELNSAIMGQITNHHRHFLRDACFMYENNIECSNYETVLFCYTIAGTIARLWKPTTDMLAEKRYAAYLKYKEYAEQFHYMSEKEIVEIKKKDNLSVETYLSAMKSTNGGLHIAMASDFARSAQMVRVDMVDVPMVKKYFYDKAVENGYFDGTIEHDNILYVLDKALSNNHLIEDYDERLLKENGKMDESCRVYYPVIEKIIHEFILEVKKDYLELFYNGIMKYELNINYT